MIGSILAVIFLVWLWYVVIRLLIAEREIRRDTGAVSVRKMIGVDE